MKVAELECFVVLAEELHFGRAARRLAVSTATVSKRINELEAQLGLRLFDRTSREVRLTSAGAAVLGAAGRVVTDVDDLRRLAAEVGAGATGAVRAVYSSGNGPYMASLIRQLHEATGPQAEVTMARTASDEGARAILDGEASIGLCSWVRPRGLAVLTVASAARNLVALPAEHPLIRKDGDLALADLAGIALVDAHPAARRNEGRWAGLGAAMPIRHVEVTTEPDFLDCVAAGYGAGFVSEPFVRRNVRSDVVARPVVDMPPDVPLDEENLLWRVDESSPIVHQLVAIATARVAADQRTGGQ